MTIKLYGTGNNREDFINTANALNLTTTHTSSDGWPQSFRRDDGLALWRVANGIMTAVIVNDRYTKHMPFTTGKGRSQDLIEASERILE